MERKLGSDLTIRWSLLFILFLTLGFQVACVGPTTPFGAIDKIKAVKPLSVEGPNPFEDESLIAEVSADEPETIDLSPRVTFYPERQIRHASTNFEIRIEDPRGFRGDSEVKLLYNGYDITKRFLSEAKRIDDEKGKLRIYKLGKLRILTGRKNRIHFVYKRQKVDKPLVSEYLAPTCNIFARNDLVSIAPFSPKDDIVKNLVDWSDHHNINPTLTAGLIAQESGFDPKAVSWSRAIGLTQVTPVAGREVARIYEEWPTSEYIRKYPVPVVKTMISTNKITAKDDWRLHPELSIRGGLTYLNYLYEYWTKEENYEQLISTFDNPNFAMTEVILASYNSGAARVKYAIQQHGDKYLEKSENLNEARKYVDKVSSYCFHFGKREVNYAKAP